MGAARHTNRRYLQEYPLNMMMYDNIVSYRCDRTICLLVVGLALFIGTTLVLQPALVWLAIAGFATVVVLASPPYLVASLAVVSTVFSRLFVTWGIAPGFLSFVHFPLVLIAVFFAVLSHARFMPRITRRLLIGMGIFGLLSSLPWIASGEGEILRLVLGWILFMEPFLGLYAILKTVPETKKYILEQLALGLALIQIPLAIWQAATLGLGDYVQGTFIRANGVGGAHELGNLSMMAALLLTVRVLQSGHHKISNLVLLSLFFIVAVLADAKQSIAGFIIILVYMLILSKKISLRIITTSTVLVLLFLLLARYYPPLTKLTQLDLYEIAIDNKLIPFMVVWQKMIHYPPYILVGLGPGASISRTSLMGLGGYLRSIPSGWITIRGSELAANVLAQIDALYPGFTQQNPISTALSGISSWVGLFGDFGVLGVITYIFLLWVVWKGTNANNGFWTQNVRALIVMGVFLGIVHSWLERPEFTLPWSLFMAVGLNKSMEASQCGTNNY